MNAMQTAFTKAVLVKTIKSTSKSAKEIGKALKSVYARIKG